MMKVKISLVLAILFIALSIWLSFSVKQANEGLFKAEAQIKTMEQELNINKYKTGILQEALELNIGKAPVPTRLTTSSRLTSNHTSFDFDNASLQSILYLKAQACSPCNMPVIEGIINAAAGNSNFQIASHTSNRHFLQSVLDRNGLTENDRVNWLKHKLYDYNNPVYDAELLFVDAKGFILGVLPLELLKERELFESWLASSLYSSDDLSDENQPSNSSDDSRSSDE